MVLPYGGRVGRRRAFFITRDLLRCKSPGDAQRAHSTPRVPGAFAPRISSRNKKKPLVSVALFPVLPGLLSALLART